MIDSCDHGDSIVVYESNCPYCEEIDRNRELNDQILELQDIIKELEEKVEELENEKLTK